MIELLKFTKTNCRPCVAVSHYLSEIASELTSQGVTITEYNIANVPDLIEKYNLQAAPTLIFTRNGVEITRIVGMTDQETILDAVQMAREQR